MGPCYNFLVCLTNEDGDLADGDGESEGADGLSAGGELLERRQEGDDAVLGDGLEQPGGPGQGLQARADGGEQGADLHHLGVGPGDVAHDQAAAYGVAESGRKK